MASECLPSPLRRLPWNRIRASSAQMRTPSVPSLSGTSSSTWTRVPSGKSAPPKVPYFLYHAYQHKEHKKLSAEAPLMGPRTQHSSRNTQPPFSAVSFIHKKHCAGRLPAPCDRRTMLRVPTIMGRTGATVQQHKGGQEGLQGRVRPCRRVWACREGREGKGSEWGRT